MATKLNIGPRISDFSRIFLSNNFRTVNAGAEFVIEAFGALFRRTLADLKGRFKRGELYLMLDVMNDTRLTAGFAGETLQGYVSDGIALDALDQKHDVNADDFFERFKALSPFELSVLEIWSNAFWYGGKDSNYIKNIDEYISPLL